jgi:hypothetical protein
VNSFNAVVLKQTPLPLLYTERQLKLLKKMIYVSQSYKQLQKVFLSRECALCLMDGQHLYEVSGT